MSNYFLLFLSILCFPLLALGQNTSSDSKFSAPPLTFTDIHMHASIKPFNSSEKGNYNHWELIEHNCDENASGFFINNSDQIPRRSQSNFESLIEGNTRVVSLSLTPFETQMVSPRLLNIKKKGISTFACLSGIELTYESFFQKEQDYYGNLASNLQFVIEGSKKPYYIKNEPYFYEIIHNRQQLKDIIHNPKRIGLVLSIEGAHALGSSFYINNKLTETPDYHQKVLENIDRLKGSRPLMEGFSDTLQYPVHFISLCHFFWNGICGHARTFSGTQELVFGVQKLSNGPFSPLGRKALLKMLDKDQGRRILIDVKHMSLKARQEYYACLDSFMLKGDTIPIISSHSTISSLSWKDKYYQKPDNYGKNKRRYLNEWTISLAKEDMQRIHRSKGMIGIMLDKYRLMGGKAKKMHSETIAGSLQRRQFLTKVLFANILTIVKAIDHQSGWDIICIGSDFDGMIIPLDGYPTSGEFPDLANDLKNFLEYPSPIFNLFTTEEIESLKFGLSSEEIVNKIMAYNMLEFLDRNLPDQP